MKVTPPHLRALEEIEKEDDISGLLEVLREEGTDGVRYALWDATGWHRDAVLDAVNTASGEIAGYDAGLQGGPERERQPGFLGRVRSEHVLPSVVVVSQREIIKRLGLPQPKVSRIIASVTKSLKGMVSQLQ